jgi:PAS domain S-box-containing protein
LRRLTGLVGHVFHAPVAYAAMLGHGDRVMSRIGSGEEYWKNPRPYPLGRVLASPVVVRDTREGLPDGTDLGDLIFFAAAPMVTACGQRLGVLVIADRVARLEFSGDELESLVELANLLAGRIEIRMIASQSVASELRCGEAEERFREVANSAPALIACNGADGACEFVNAAWLEFTGRHKQDELGDGWQQAIHQRHRERVVNLYWAALQAHRPFMVELPLCRHDGVFRWMRGSGIPRFLKDGSFAGFLARLTDLSDFNDTAAEGR